MSSSGAAKPSVRIDSWISKFKVKKMSFQYTLSVDRHVPQTLENFIEGENSELIRALHNQRDDFHGLWLYGEKSSGRSHLLRAFCDRDHEELDRRSLYISCGDFRSEKIDQFRALKLATGFGESVAIDDVDLFLGNREFEVVLFDIYERLREEGGTLIVSHCRSALVAQFALADLGSRFRSLMNFQLKELSDASKVSFLIQRAEMRGFSLPDSVIGYWLSHAPRGMDILINDFETLSEVMLQKKQVLTVPLFKEVLGY